MKYKYEDLSPKQFEDLVIAVCQTILGSGVQGFSEGPDGGRDAIFRGVAERHPSKAEPWRGTVIIQAKHTNKLNSKFSDTDFFNPDRDSSIIAKEIPKIIRLRQNKELDHYMLFSNRKLTGDANSNICKYISREVNLPEESIYLCGVEQLERYLKRFPDIAKEVDIDPADSPLIVSPDELANIILALAKHLKTLPAVSDNPPTPRIPYEDKNNMNNMTPEYAKAQRRKYLKETKIIDDFLAAPENNSLLLLYQSAVDEFQHKIIANRKDHQTFDKIMEYLSDSLFDRDGDLSRNKRLTRAMLFYMYWKCDIGNEDNA
ncbi:MAG: restriction endonuclease [Nitrospirae bacterium]|nr:restriction endonuclease [Nitrospirota bacterium]